jgi:rhamnogalacturonan endolyase
MRDLNSPTLVLLASTIVATMASTTPAAVTVSEDDSAFTIANGIVAARVDKKSGDLVSMKYKGMEMLATILTTDGLPDVKADPPGANSRGFGPFTDHQYGFWSHDAMGPRDSAPAIARVNIDPRSNGGERGEISVKGISNGRRMGTGPGSNAQGNFIADIEIRYTLGRGDSGVYTYCIFEHKPGYAASSLTEARFCFKLNDFFDWMLVDQHHNKLYPKDAREDKYDYTSVQFEHPAFGWASTTKNIGCFLVNPSLEYMSGGPTKVEFLCHRDTNPTAAPCILNYWRSSHYGGSSVDVAQGEHWTKVVGPFLLYCNAGSDPQVMWKDAIAQASRESKKWPYDWVAGVDYPHHRERGTVKGQFVLNDPLAPRGAKMSRLLVGVTHAAYTVPTARPAAQNTPREVDWQTDAKHYEFWVRGDDRGRFAIDNVRPGNYTLHAVADGVLGEYAKANVTVAAGKATDLGRLSWTPVRRGKQLWDIGVPNRNGSEFLKGDDYFHDGMPLLYAKLFPNDVNYVIGKSDFRKDWYFEQVPHSEDPNARPGPFGGGGGTGRATPWLITFELPKAPKGKATLRFGIASGGARQIEVTVNDKSAGTLDQLPGDSAIGRNGIQGLWFERELAFDASLMKAGTNMLKLTVPAGPVNAGVIYDYLRLELDENARVMVSQ